MVESATGTLTDRTPREPWTAVPAAIRGPVMVRELSARAFPAAVAPAVLAIILSLATTAWSDFPVLLSVMIGVQGVAIAFRGYMVRSCCDTMADDTPGRWFARWVVFVMVGAGAWVVLVCAALAYDGLGVSAMLWLISTAGIVSGGTINFCPSLWLTWSWQALQILPLALVPLFTPGIGFGEAGWGFEVTMLIYLVVMMVVARQMHQEFWGRVATHQLLAQRNDQLLEARLAADRANAAKSMFLASMTHELRTPLNGVMGMASLLLTTKLSREQREYAHAIRSSGDALQSLINDVLDFSRIEAGKVHLDSLAFDVADVVEEAVEVVAIRAQEKCLRLATVMDPSVSVPVVGDPARLRQVLINLLSNAVKFTDEGEVTVRVRPSNHHADDLRYDAPPVGVCFEVSDTGPGIPEAERERIFEAFTQADSATTRKFGGTGLGLAIVRQIVDLMNGKVEVEGRPGGGTAFRVHLLLRRGTGVEWVDSSGRGTQEPDLAGHSVVVASAHEPTRSGLRLLLQRAGTSTIEASSGKEAERLVRKIEPRPLAVLADKDLPDMPGVELAKRVAEASSTPVMLLVPLARLREIDQAPSPPGVVGHVSCPVRREQLFQRLLALAHPDTSQWPTSALNRLHTTIRRLREQISRGANGDGMDESAEPVPMSPALPGGERPRVLLVEDNLINQRVARVMLEKLGMDVHVACDGVEALDASREHRFRLVFMDCHMPRLDGYEATRRLRADEADGHHTPVVALTANATDIERERCFACGMDDYLTKPLRLAALHDVINKWIHGVTAE